MHWLTLNGRLHWTFLPLVFILLVGLSLRLYGTDWDSGFGFHPDERDIYMRSGCMYDLLTEAPGHQDCGYVRDQPDAEPGLPGLGTFLDPDRSPLNPHWFPLGSILIYVLVFFRSIIELFTDIDALDMRFAGRTLSALADVGSIFLVYVLGRRMFGSGVGLLAAAFTALAVIHIQNSHFYRPETFSVLFTLASFWAMLRMVERKRIQDSALLGLMVGLALAPKVNVLPVVLPLALAYWYRVLDSVDGRWSQITPEVVQRVLGHAAVAAIVAVGVFFVSAPYAFLDIGAFWGDLSAQFKMVRNAGLLPFTVQYIGTPPFLYQLQTILGLGPGSAPRSGCLARSALHGRDGLREEEDPPKRSTPIGLGGTQLFDSGKLRGPVPSLCISSHAFLNFDGLADVVVVRGVGSCGTGIHYPAIAGSSTFRRNSPGRSLGRWLPARG